MLLDWMLEKSFKKIHLFFVSSKWLSKQISKTAFREMKKNQFSFFDVAKLSESLIWCPKLRFFFSFHLFVIMWTFIFFLVAFIPFFVQNDKFYVTFFWAHNSNEKSAENFSSIFFWVFHQHFLDESTRKKGSLLLSLSYQVIGKRTRLGNGQLAKVQI